MAVRVGACRIILFILFLLVRLSPPLCIDFRPTDLRRGFPCFNLRWHIPSRILCTTVFHFRSGVFVRFFFVCIQAYRGEPQGFSMQSDDFPALPVAAPSAAGA